MCGYDVIFFFSLSEQLWPLLRERAFGDMDGKTIAEFRRRAADAGFANAWDYTPDGGETIQDLRVRAGEFFRVRERCTEQYRVINASFSALRQVL